MTDTESRIHQIVAYQFNVDLAQELPDTDLRVDLGADSLDEIELAMAIEEEFGIELDLDDPEVLGVKTVGDLVRLVDNLPRK